MSSDKRLQGILLIFCLMLIVLAGCEYDGPTSGWKTRPSGNAAPVISSVDPVSAAPGVFEINIAGQNFSGNMVENFVYFGKTKAEIIQSSPTAIKVLRPNTFGDSIKIQVAVSGAIESAKFSPYPVAKVTENLGVFLASESINAMTVDKDENVYAIVGSKQIVKITPDGLRSDYGEAAYTTSDMRCGPDGTLYLQRSSYKKIYRLVPGAAEAEEFGTYSGKINVFDIDQNGNIYGGGQKTGINVIRKDDGKTFTAGDYANFNILAVRVFQNYVYVLANNVGKDTTVASGVYRNAITSSFGELGENDLVLDWKNTGSWASSEYYDFTFSQAGDMLIATAKTNPVLRFKDGVLSPFYKDILPTTAEELVWGSGNYLYQRVGGEKPGIQRINTGMAGAPYYGL